MFRLRTGRRAQTRFYARLDDKGRCETLWAAAEPPERCRWVEVTELNPFWIGRPLPLSARSNTGNDLTVAACVC